MSHTSRPVVKGLLGDNFTQRQLNFKGGITTDYNDDDNTVDIKAGFTGEFASPEVTTTIYARLTGNDQTGKGTLAKPYRKAARALEDVLHFYSPGNLVEVNIDGLGVEIMPPDYQLPVVKTCYNFELDFAHPYFFTKCGFMISATPKPIAVASAIGVGDVLSILPLPGNNLVRITLNAARPSYLAGALRGKFLVGLFPIGDNAVIFDSTDTTIDICYDGEFFLPAAPWTVSECSAELQGSNAMTSAAITAVNSMSMALRGVKITNVNPGTAFAWVECGEPFLEFCDIEGFAFGPGSFYGPFNSYIHGKPMTIGSVSTFMGGCYLENIPSIGVSGASVDLRFAASVARNCPALGPRQDFVFAGSGAPLGVIANAALITDSVIDAFFGTPGVGVFVSGGNSALRNVVIDNAADDGIRVDNGGFVHMENVTGTGNAGLGINISDGKVRVLDDATNITGVGGDMLVGNLPIRAWDVGAGNFRNFAPIKNEFDNLFPPVGDEAVPPLPGGTTGSRLYQRA